ncbi:GerMN domain-containing protein [Ornithinibacillus halotolerans]|uniref:GerMN domain-containing protein n=1 Tax=Ornithinibacillus halotolerans TaxID=1274357 RepID=A0A916RJV9_9BACI|nr:GerMN domain-containing protein [Ornithinibacillus halotolerans]GGA60137.1 hypothetical protein GCM10008025_00200 [Ornithinibacillus halotolerans]
MKQSDFESQFQKFNEISLTKQESSESYKLILSNYRTAKKQKKTRMMFNHILPGMATVALVLVFGWLLFDILQPSIQQPGEQSPTIVEEDEQEENINEPENNNEEDPVPKNITNACMEDEDAQPTSQSVVVYFECYSTDNSPSPFIAVEREIENEGIEFDPIVFAIQQLLQGPTEEEVKKGYGSIFNKDTAETLRGIELQSTGHLIVDFDDFSTIIPNGSSSAASMAMLESLNRTLAQFEEVKTIEYRFDGSCEAFYGWIQVGECTYFTADSYRTEVEAEAVKEELLEKSEIIFNHLLAKEWEQVAHYIHHEKGLVYSPFSNVGDEDDLHFSRLDVWGFYKDESQYIWSWDQSEAEFMATPNDFVDNLLKKRNNYVYEYDEITYNDSDMGTMINTIHEVFPNAIYVEYLDEPDPNSRDWTNYQALRFVFEEIDNEWYFVALVRGAHNP